MLVDQIYAKVFGDLRPSLALPTISIRFYRFTSLTSNIRFTQGCLQVKISDLLLDAPDSVQEALAYILLSKLFRQRPPQAMVQQYRLHLAQTDLTDRLNRIRQERGRKRLEDPKGDHFDLEALFGEVNSKYFGNTIRPPRVGWSQQRSRTVLGHYDASHHAIAISRVLDQKHVPAYVVEYVMYHEVLHIKHPVEHKGTRRTVHPRAFKCEEKLFAEFYEAKDFLKRGLR